MTTQTPESNPRPIPEFCGKAESYATAYDIEVVYVNAKDHQLILRVANYFWQPCHSPSFLLYALAQRVNLLHGSLLSELLLKHDFDWCVDFVQHGSHEMLQFDFFHEYVASWRELTVRDIDKVALTPPFNMRFRVSIALPHLPADIVDSICSYLDCPFICYRADVDMRPQYFEGIVVDDGPESWLEHDFKVGDRWRIEMDFHEMISGQWYPFRDVVSCFPPPSNELNASQFCDHDDDLHSLFSLDDLGANLSHAVAHEPRHCCVLKPLCLLSPACSREDYDRRHFRQYRHYFDEPESYAKKICLPGYIVDEVRRRIGGTFHPGRTPADCFMRGCWPETMFQYIEEQLHSYPTGTSTTYSWQHWFLFERVERPEKCAKILEHRSFIPGRHAIIARGSVVLFLDPGETKQSFQIYAYFHYSGRLLREPYEIFLRRVSKYVSMGAFERFCEVRRLESEDMYVRTHGQPRASADYTVMNQRVRHHLKNQWELMTKEDRACYRDEPWRLHLARSFRRSAGTPGSSDSTSGTVSSTSGHHQQHHGGGGGNGSGVAFHSHPLPHPLPHVRPPVGAVPPRNATSHLPSTVNYRGGGGGASGGPGVTPGHRASSPQQVAASAAMMQYWLSYTRMNRRTQELVAAQQEQQAQAQAHAHAHAMADSVTMASQLATAQPLSHLQAPLRMARQHHQHQQALRRAQQGIPLPVPTPGTPYLPPFAGSFGDVTPAPGVAPIYGAMPAYSPLLFHPPPPPPPPPPPAHHHHHNHYRQQQAEWARWHAAAAAAAAAAAQHQHHPHRMAHHHGPVSGSMLLSATPAFPQLHTHPSHLRSGWAEGSPPPPDHLGGGGVEGQQGLYYDEDGMDRRLFPGLPLPTNSSPAAMGTVPPPAPPPPPPPPPPTAPAQQPANANVNPFPPGPPYVRNGPKRRRVTPKRDESQ